MFGNNSKDFINSILEFDSKPEFWKACLGSVPKYFLHLKYEGADLFGLAKFCVIKDITLEEYFNKNRFPSDSTISKQHLSKKLNLPWTPFNKVNPQLRTAFKTWIHNFFPNYNPINAKLITISSGAGLTTRKRKITPEELENRLEHQIEIGKVGEHIAYQYELERLSSQKIKNPEKCVSHISLKNASAGFDISTITKNETRFIEVKSTTASSNEYYLTENEVHTLELLENNAYLYIVKIENLKKKTGKVYKELKNPIKKLRLNNNLHPIAYKVNIY